MSFVRSYIFTSSETPPRIRCFPLGVKRIVQNLFSLLISLIVSIVVKSSIMQLVFHLYANNFVSAEKAGAISIDDVFEYAQP